MPNMKLQIPSPKLGEFLAALVRWEVRYELRNFFQDDRGCPRFVVDVDAPSDGLTNWLPVPLDVKSLMDALGPERPKSIEFVEQCLDFRSTRISVLTRVTYLKSTMICWAAIGAEDA